ncbi:hypothetical protein BGW39_000911 [Mortierella sp. 14UC]|nr:hypothetical protein BGW39_000911 [Mortierella sp. 14UC]
MAKKTQLQPFQRGPLGRILQVEAHHHADSNQHIVFWDDILEAFPGATKVLNGNVVVTRARDSSLRILEPWCIKETAVSIQELTRRNIEQWAALTAPGDMSLENKYAPTTCTLAATETRPFKPLKIPTETDISSMKTDNTEDDEEQNVDSKDGSPKGDHESIGKEWRAAKDGTERTRTELRMINNFADIFGIFGATGAVGAGVANGVDTPKDAALPKHLIRSPLFQNNASPNSAVEATPSDQVNTRRVLRPFTGPTLLSYPADPSDQVNTASVLHPFPARVLYSYAAGPSNPYGMDLEKDEILIVTGTTVSLNFYYRVDDVDIWEPEKFVLLQLVQQ